MNIDEIRQQYPQYSQLSDNELADALHQKFYPQLPRAEFYSQIGVPFPAADVAAEAIKNAPASAVKFAQDTAQPFLHPVDTAESIGNIGKGVLQKFGIVGGDDSEKYADAVGQFFKDRYGGWENIKKTIATDPVGAIGDLSTVLTMGGSALERAPSVVGKIGEVASRAGTVTNPLMAAGAAVKTTGKAAAIAADALTQKGYDNIVRAAEAGNQGLFSKASNAYWANKARAVPMTDVVDEAKDALRNLQADAGQAYRAGMAEVSKDKTILDFRDVDAAINRLQNVKNFKGVELSPNTLDVRTQLSNAIGEWKTLDPKEYHTPEGFDALKQKIGDIKDAQEYGSPAWKIASDAYNSVRQTIAKQAPVYDKVMKGYTEAQEQLSNLSKELSIGNKVNPGTALRKLQSVMRDGVNTSFGYRKELMNKLVENGADTLPYAVAGQQMSQVLPSGLVGRGIAAGATLAAGGGVAAHAIPAVAAAAPVGAAALPLGLVALGLSSPALVGTAAYGAGLGARVLGRPKLGLVANQIGRQPFRVTVHPSDAR